MSFGKLFKAGAAALAGVLASCGGDGPRVWTVHTHPAGTWSFFTGATTKGPMWVQVFGAPFDGMDQDATAQAVADSLTKAVSPKRKGSEFTTDPAQAQMPDTMRVIVAFGVPENYNGANICGAEPPPVDETRRPLTVVAAFCKDTDRLAEVRARLDEVPPFETEAVRVMLVSIANQLFVKGRD